MAIMHMLVAIVAILVYVFGRVYLGTPICWERKSRSNEKDKDYRTRSSVRAQESLKRGRKSRERSRTPVDVCSSYLPSNLPQESEISVPRSGTPGRLGSAFPKHKTDPRIFIDEEEIGQEPRV